MPGIGSLAGSTSVAPAWMQGLEQQGGVGRHRPSPALRSAIAQTITNGEGETLNDLRGELKEAIGAALKSGGDDGDRHAKVESAIDSVLEAHGFDPAKVRAEMQTRMGAAERVSAGASGGASEQERQAALVQQFLQRFPAGSNVDVTG